MGGGGSTGSVNFAGDARPPNFLTDPSLTERIVALIPGSTMFKAFRTAATDPPGEKHYGLAAAMTALTLPVDIAACAAVYFEAYDTLAFYALFAMVGKAGFNHLFDDVYRVNRDLRRANGRHE